jgi:signal transduction histidine kinase
LLGCVLLLPLLALLSRSFAERWAEWLAGAVFVVLTAITIALVPLFEKGVADQNYVIQVMGIVFVVMGAGLLLPFDGPAMAVLGVISLLLHVGFTVDFPLAQNFPSLFATFTAVLIATVGAQQLFDGRVSDYRARLAQTGLLAAKEEIVRAQEKLIHARADFVAMLTHDIKNPLAAVDGFLHVLRDEGDLGGEQKREIVGHMQAAVRTALTLATNFLDVSKIEADHLRLKRKPTEIAGILKHVTGHYGCLAELKNIRVVVDVESDLPRVSLDEAAFDRVLANLLTNAIQHTPKGGEIRLGARRLDDLTLEVVVEDTGEGVPEGALRDLFSRYSPAAHRVDSTGLGLYIVRVITEAHGGMVTAENRADAPGARFRVHLPIEGAAPIRDADS